MPHKLLPSFTSKILFKALFAKLNRNSFHFKNIQKYFVTLCPQIVPGLSLACPWIVPGLSLDFYQKNIRNLPNLLIPALLIFFH